MTQVFEFLLFFSSFCSKPTTTTRAAALVTAPMISGRIMAWMRQYSHMIKVNERHKMANLIDSTNQTKEIKLLIGNFLSQSKTGTNRESSDIRKYLLILQ